MDRVKINTAQNVFLDYEAAGIGDRTIAGIIDTIVLVCYLIFASLLIQESTSIATQTIVFLPYIFYFLVSEIFLNGQTLGKRSRNIKVTRLDGTQPRIGDYFIRWFFRFLEVDLSFGMIAVVSLFFRGNGQRLGDMAAGTMVVKINKSVSLDDTLYQELDEAYVPTIKETVHLTEKEISLTKEVFDTINVEKPSPQIISVGEKMKATLESKMNISSPLSAREFLWAVIQDYNHLKS